MREHPLFHLTRHFFRSLFTLGVLSEAGTGSFTRMLPAAGGVLAAMGLVFARVYLGKYGALNTVEDPEPYRLAALGDQAFLLALPMWMAAFVTILVGHALFPDETDYRVLMPQPVTRRVVFLAKLFALALFCGLVVVCSHAALFPVFLLIAMSPWAEQGLAAQAAARATSGLLASGFAVLAVVAVYGVLVAAAPRRRLVSASALLRSGLLCALVVSLPLLMRLPGQGRAIMTGESWVFAVPPVWFASLERRLLGSGQDPGLGGLVLAAATALPAAAAVAMWSYAVLYRRFDRVMRAPARTRAGGPHARSSIRFAFDTPYARVFLGVRRFTILTLRRSVLHQGILVVVSAAGAGLVLNGLIGADVIGWWRRGGAPGRDLIDAVASGSFTLIFVAALAARLSLAVPREPRANWMFRCAQQEKETAAQLEAAADAVRCFGVFVPVMLMLPLQWLVLGAGGALAAAVSAVLLGLLLVEILMRGWARIPFTCSYIPGKGFLPLTLLLGVAGYLLFIRAGGALAAADLRSAGIAGVFAAGVAASALLLWSLRVRRSRAFTPVFDDELPSELTSLGLSAD